MKKQSENDKKTWKIHLTKDIKLDTRLLFSNHDPDVVKLLKPRYS